VARLEREGAARERANRAILSLMQDGELDILIGTQLVVTRHPRPVASLIGLIYPDAALHLPDFRAAERTYHTLREVLTLADPDARDAEVVLQTYVPQHHVMQALRQQNPAIFYKAELADRAALGYPPFGRLIGLQVSGTREEPVAAAAARWADLIRREKATTPGNSLEVLGPIPASPPRLRKRFRWRLLVKGRDEAALRQAVRATLKEIETASRAGGLRYDIDVDPQSLL
jgi:primosomal protein N' (replication factor Y)